MYSKKKTSFQSGNVIKLFDTLWDCIMAVLRFLNRPLFGLISLLVFGAVIAVMIFTRIDSNRYTHYMVMHTYEVLSTVDKVSQLAVDAESSVRGYVVSHNESYLQPYQQISNDPDHRKGEVFQTLDKLYLLTTDNKEQQNNIIKLEDLVTQKMKLMAAVIRITHEKSFEAVVDFGKNQKGRYLMQDIKAQLKKIHDIEEKLLDGRIEKDNQNTQIFIYITLGTLLLMILTNSAAFMAIQKEFSQRKKAEKMLRDNAAFQNNILESSMYMIIACKPDGTISLFNKAAENLLGYSAEELVGKHTPSVFHDDQEMYDHKNILERELNRPVNGIEIFTAKPIVTGSEEREWTYIAKDGSRIPVLLSVSTLRNDNGKITGYMGIAKDISERKNIDKLKNEFISTVSHELRTPLTSIRGSLGLVVNHMQDQLNSKTANLVQIAYKNTERLTRLINDILDIEKIESGNIIINKQPIRISDALKQSIEEMKGFADQYHITMNIDDQVEEIFVSADSDRLQQVLGNLISNAIKFSPMEEKIILSAKKVDDMVLITVEDRGSGIPQAFKEKIFGKFAQADSSSSRQKGGTGLGLNICKSLVEAMDGKIGFDSVAGDTKFYFTLPIIETVSALKNFPDVILQGNKKILICEDDSDIALLLQMILQKENFICRIATSAEEAKALLENEEFGAMTLDLNLPGQDGISFLKELRSDPKFIHLPVIVISAEAEEHKKALKGEAIGVVDWLTKPIDADRLTYLLKALPSSNSQPVILHLEDDRDFVEMLSLSLQDKATIVSATSLREAHLLLTQQHFDLAIVDIKLPDGNGLDILPELSKRSIPIIILSVHETPEEIKNQVTGSMVKSRISEDKIIKTIKLLISGDNKNGKVD